MKAQVKIKFKNINGERMVCSRSLAVTQRRATVTQKTIDNSLLRYDPVTGEVKMKEFFFFPYKALKRLHIYP